MLSRRLEGWGDTVPSPRASPCQCATCKGRAMPALQEGGRLRPLRSKGRSTTGCGGSGREPQRDRRRPHLTAASAGGRDALPGAAANIRGLLIGDKGFIRPQLRADLGGGGSGCKRPCARTWPTRGIPASHGCW